MALELTAAPCRAFVSRDVVRRFVSSVKGVRSARRDRSSGHGAVSSFSFRNAPFGMEPEELFGEGERLSRTKLLFPIEFPSRRSVTTAVTVNVCIRARETCDSTSNLPPPLGDRPLRSVGMRRSREERERRPFRRAISELALDFPHVSDFEFCGRQRFLSREQGAAIKFKFEGRGPFRACMRDAIGVSVFDMHGNDNRRFE